MSLSLRKHDGKKFQNIGFGKDLLDMAPKAQAVTLKNRQKTSNKQTLAQQGKQQSEKAT